MNERLLSMLRAAGIPYPPPLPARHAPPNTPQLMEWAESQCTPMLRQIATKLVNNIIHISFQQFQTSLNKTIRDFNARVSAPYLLWLSEGAKRSSDCWVPGLAFQYSALKTPQHIFTTDSLIRHIQEQGRQEYNILLLDDASYSGTQKSNAITWQFNEKLPEGTTINLFCGIPYLTAKAKKAIASAIDRTYLNKVVINLFFLEHTEIPLAIDCLSEEEQTYVQRHQLNLERTLLYFDHSFPDDFSNFFASFTSTNLLRRGDLVFFCGFKVCQDVGYQTISMEDMKALEAAIEVNREVEFRGVYAGHLFPLITKPYRDKNGPYVPQCFAGFKKTALPLEIQCAYDYSVMTMTAEHRMDSSIAVYKPANGRIQLVKYNGVVVGCEVVSVAPKSFPNMIYNFFRSCCGQRPGGKASHFEDSDDTSAITTYKGIT